MFIKRIVVVAIAVAAMLTGVGLKAANEAPGSAATAKLRVGTYDSRSVALAFGRSKLGVEAAGRLMAEAKQAEKSGDQKQLDALKKQGSNLQNLRHMQVFGNAPIQDMLANMQPAIQEQAHTQKLDLIVRDIDIAFQGANVELVDITKGLIDSCGPTQETLRIIDQMKHHPPLPLEQFPLEHEHGKNSEAASNPTAEADALSAAKAWLELIDTGKYENSWKQASAHFQAVVPSDRWLKEMQNLRDPLGKLVSRETVSHVYCTELPDAPNGEYVVIEFKTEFERDKKVVER